MSVSELFEIWAPAGRIWSQWAKPVLFANRFGPAIPSWQAVEWPSLDAPNDHATALIIDLPREMSVDYGIAAARDGYWPVPLFNCAFGPSAVCDVRVLMDHLVLGGQELLKISVPSEAPPAFLIDSKRMLPEGSLLPGNFDNRYIMLPQDFPSAGFLKAHGITRVVWIRQSAGPTVTFLTWQADDLAHILKRWQEGGIEIYSTQLGTNETERLDVPRPSRFRSIFYRAFAVMGLRRNSAGGFGGIIPQPSSGG
jgi:hypothetical protein